MQLTLITDSALSEIHKGCTANDKGSFTLRKRITITQDNDCDPLQFGLRCQPGLGTGFLPGIQTEQPLASHLTNNGNLRSASTIGSNLIKGLLAFVNMQLESPLLRNGQQPDDKCSRPRIALVDSCAIDLECDVFEAMFDSTDIQYDLFEAMLNSARRLQKVTCRLIAPADESGQELSLVDEWFRGIVMTHVHHHLKDCSPTSSDWGFCVSEQSVNVVPRYNVTAIPMFLDESTTLGLHLPSELRSRAGSYRLPAAHETVRVRAIWTVRDLFGVWLSRDTIGSQLNSWSGGVTIPMFPQFETVLKALETELATSSSLEEYEQKIGAMDLVHSFNATDE